ncbi:Inositolphosphorylceramide synthase subunit Kei1-domain-containing protein [Triangularia verruculosa]|uniref:Inositolphosphorylceramide synthase subunit Kei1-domain-containing protein n=1 Tax=Triangularia verruculosa TaxID=2587418 RepID=A0AAN6XLZ3_9PEZI|nr:Inositolphosphorylceramide synthase subunit Kei1-domain-containing protein [Triangularia verruculosa]
MLSLRSSRRLRLPRPRSFLGFMSLQTGTELVSIALLFNKAIGIYGLLTLVTGFQMSILQFTAYFLSIAVVAVLAYCLPHIGKGTPFQNLLLAWVYAIDTMVSGLYTTAFATSWYLQLKEMQAGTASEVTGQEEVHMTERRDDAATPVRDDGIDTAFSMVLIIGFTLVRIYFSLVIMAYARAVILRFVDERVPESDEDDESGSAPNPFAVGAPLGEGLQGKIGRYMISVGKSYWLGGRKEDEEWAKDAHSKFRSSRR